MEVVASLSQGRTAAAQCGLFTHKSVPVIFEPPCTYIGDRRCTEARKFIKKVRTSGKESVNLQMIPIDRWVQYYQNLLTGNRPENEGTKNITPIQMDGEIVEVSEERVRKAVRELKNGKSCGPEGVYAEMLKHGTDKLITMLTWVINR